MRPVTHPSSVQVEVLRERVPKRVVGHVRREHKNLAAPSKVPVLLRHSGLGRLIEDEPFYQPTSEVSVWSILSVPVEAKQETGGAASAAPSRLHGIFYTP